MKELLVWQGNVVSQKRSCLSSQNVNRLAFLHENIQ